MHVPRVFAAPLVIAALAIALIAPAGTSAPAPRFEVVVTPRAVKVVRGSSFAVAVTVRWRPGFTAPVKVTLANLPAGTRATSVVLNPQHASGTVRISARQPAVLGRTATVTARGRAGTLSAARTFRLTVVRAFTYAIKPALTPTGPVVPPAHTAAVSKDELGVKSTYYGDSVILRPTSQAQLQAFLGRYNGRILETDAVPQAPPGIGVTVSAAARQPTEYLIKVDASRVQLADFAADAASAALGTHADYSSTQAAKLIALTAHEQANGVSASPNYVLTDHAVLLQTRERPTGATFNDAFNTAQFPRFQSGGSKASVTAAWSWVRAHGIARRVRVAIIDGGFWLNAAGNPLTGPGDGSDLPANPIQYDFPSNDYIAGAANPTPCSGGSVCPWHGNRSAGVAVGLANNSSAAAGTGGFVGDPMLFQTDIRDRVQRDRAVRTAIAWRADVISMSFGGPCNYACRQDERSNDTNRGYEQARAAGVVLVASSGNSGADAGAEDAWVHPCITDGIICVGALNDNGNTSQSYSNFGWPVDIWAPTNVPAMPDPGNPNALASHSGTSASAPFVAGITAMMKAINPALTSDGVRDILVNTAWKDSPDAKVTAYVNALSAVKAAAQDRLPNDRFEPNDGETAATTLAPNRYDDLNLHAAGQRDFYRVVVPNRSRLAFNFTSSDDLGKLNFGYGLVAEQSCGYPDGEVSTPRANGHDLTVANVPAGRYVLPVGGGTRMPYDMVIGRTAAALPADALERDAAGNANNSFAHARAVGGGYYNATIDPGKDVDFYEFSSVGSFFDPRLGGLVSRFEITTSDVPLRITLYNSAGNVVRTAQAPADCTTQPFFDSLPTGSFRIKVESVSGDSGAYAFEVGRRYVRGTGFLVEKPWYLDPGGPVEHVIIDHEDDFGLRIRIATTIFGSLRLIGPNLAISILSTKGQVLVQGRPVFQGGLAIGATLSFQKLSPTGAYYLKVTRALGGAVAPKANGKLAGMHYTLAFGK